MLAIAVSQLHKPSETFLRDHIAVIAPGQTVLLVNQREEDTFGLQALTGITQYPPLMSSNRLVARIGNSVYARARSGIGPRGRLPRARCREVTAFLKAHGVRTVLAEYLTNAVSLIEPAAEAGCALFAHAHGFDATLVPQTSSRWRRRYGDLFAAADGIFAPSAYLANRVAALGCPKNKLHVSPCGIDPARFSPTSRAPMRALAVGRLVPKKAPHLTIAAFAQATQDLPDARLDMIGDGDLWELCRDTIADHGAAGRIVLHGGQPNEVVRRYLARASLFLQHSVTSPSGDMEGLPVGILEAMASAVPVIATRHSGIPEAVIDGTTGVLVDEHDVDGMANAIRGLLLEPKRAEILGDAGRDRAMEHFTIDHTRAALRRGMGLEFPQPNGLV